MQATHIDTCLGCYLQDHHNRPGELLLGATVDGATSALDVMTELLQELQGRMIDSESFNYDSAKGAIKSLFCEIADLNAPFDSSLEIIDPDDQDGLELCQAWFVLTWEEID